MLNLLDRRFLGRLHFCRRLAAKSLSSVCLELASHNLLLARHLGFLPLSQFNCVVPLLFFGNLACLCQLLVHTLAHFLAFLCVFSFFRSSNSSRSRLQLFSFLQFFLSSQRTLWLGLFLTNNYECFLKVRVVHMLLYPLHGFRHSPALSQKQRLLCNIFREPHILNLCNFLLVDVRTDRQTDRLLWLFNTLL